MGRNVLEETGRVFKELFGDAKVIIIADENTWSPQSANALSINSDIASPLISVIVSFVGLVIDHVMNHGAQ
jgi:hypothetical protein